MIFQSLPLEYINCDSGQTNSSFLFTLDQIRPGTFCEYFAAGRQLAAKASSFCSKKKHLFVQNVV